MQPRGFSPRGRTNTDTLFVHAERLPNGLGETRTTQQFT